MSCHGLLSSRCVKLSVNVVVSDVSLLPEHCAPRLQTVVVDVPVGVLLHDVKPGIRKNGTMVWYPEPHFSGALYSTYVPGLVLRDNFNVFVFTTVAVMTLLRCCHGVRGLARECCISWMQEERVSSDQTSDAAHTRRVTTTCFACERLLHEEALLKRLKRRLHGGMYVAGSTSRAPSVQPHARSLGEARGADNMTVLELKAAVRELTCKYTAAMRALMSAKRRLALLAEKDTFEDVLRRNNPQVR